MKAVAMGMRSLARDWRAGELTVLAIAAVIGIAALSSVAFFTSRIAVTVQQQASEVLAADLVVSSGRALPADLGPMANALGLRQANVSSFPSVVYAGTNNTLVAVKAVSETYPLRGRIRISDQPFSASRVADSVPPAGEAWAESRVFARLGLSPGDSVRLGAITLRLALAIDYLPDQGFQFVDLAPTLLINRRDLEATDLLRPGSRVTHSLLLAGEPGAVARAKQRLGRLEDEFITIRDLGDVRPEISEAAARAQRFLGLSSLVSALLSAVAVAMAARRHASRRLDSVALMKCMGASQGLVLRQGLVQLLVLGLACGLAGSLLGYAAQAGLGWLLRDVIQGNLPPPALSAWAVGPLASLLILTGFALAPLIELKRVPPARVLRRDLGPPPLGIGAVYGLALAAYLLAVYWLVTDLKLLSYVVAISLVAALALGACGLLLVWSVKRLRKGVGVAWRYGLANIARRGRESTVQLVGFGLGLMVMLLLGLTRDDLMAQWQASLPENAPDHFMINIQPGEIPAFKSLMTRNGLPEPALSPLVRARVTEVNGVPVTERTYQDPRNRRWLERERNLSWSASLQDGNQVLEGEWWDVQAPVPGLLSVEQEFARQLGLGLGDLVRFDLAGEAIEARVSSIRRVRWDSFRPNFFLVLSPGTVDDSLANFLTSLYVPPSKRGVLMDLARELPGITVLDVGAILDQVRGVMDKASLAVQYVFLFTVAAGIVVLLAAVQSTGDERRYESAMLRTLGASRKVVLMGVLSEFGMLGILSGLLAAAGANIAAYLLAVNVFQLEGQWNLGLWLAGPLSGLLVVGVSGYFATRSVVNHPPVSTLRNEHA